MSRISGTFMEPAGGNWLRDEWQRKRDERAAMYGPRFGLAAPPEPEAAPAATASAARTTSGADLGAGTDEEPRRTGGDPFREFAEATRRFRAEQGMS